MPGERAKASGCQKNFKFNVVNNKRLGSKMNIYPVALLWSANRRARRLYRHPGGAPAGQAPQAPWRLL
jgi:hypothetical protein